MLMELNIDNVVLIDRLNLAFEAGLCVLTGETGAGKSVLLDSLGLALGMRAESGLVRRGADNARVSAAFQISENHEVKKILDDAGIILDDELLILRRVVYKTGKSRAFINDQPVSIALLKQVGDRLVEIHGQFETHGLLNPANHRAMLDSYAGIELEELAQLWNKWKSLELEYNDLLKASATAREEEEYLKHSLEDLSNLEPKAGEEAELSQMRERLKNQDMVLEGLNTAYSLLNGEYDPVQKAWAELDKIAVNAGDILDNALDALSRASLEINEANAVIQNAIDEMQGSDYSLEDVDDRLYALRMQARKHKCSPDDLPVVKDRLQAQLDLICNADDAILECKSRCDKAREKYISLANKISEKRKQTALKLNKLVQGELAPLKLDKARFVTQIDPLDEVDWSANGIDRARFLVATNPNQDPADIGKIASGGEMSRFMLALKVIIAQAGSTHSFIFDEVDAGIGGATADAVGERLSRLAQSKQVLVVTHAPQVAARADHHWVVSKSGDDEVKTDISLLSTRKQRCEEIARMLAGADITDEARAAADRLIA